MQVAGHKLEHHGTTEVEKGAVECHILSATVLAACKHPADNAGEQLLNSRASKRCVAATCIGQKDGQACQGMARHGQAHRRHTLGKP